LQHRSRERRRVPFAEAVQFIGTKRRRYANPRRLVIGSSRRETNSEHLCAFHAIPHRPALFSSSNFLPSLHFCRGSRPRLGVAHITARPFPPDDIFHLLSPPVPSVRGTAPSAFFFFA
ncbi:MAG: hypothetical protein BJ554DRAFT_7854, partial [Olpidium bornovanus]